MCLQCQFVEGRNRERVPCLKRGGAWPKWGSCSLSCQACRKKRIRSRCAASRKKCTICSGRVNRQVPLDDDAVETVIQKPGSAQRASRMFPSVASSDVWLDTKIIGPGDRWNQVDCAHKPGPPRLGVSRAQPLVIISRMLNPLFPRGTKNRGRD